MCHDIMGFWNEAYIKIVILMRKEFDKNELLMEKKATVMLFVN